MGFRINTNVQSLHAVNTLTGTNKSLSKSYEKLSSGLRINKAADDSAGIAVSSKLGAQIVSLNQAIRNANDGISVIQTAESALNEIYNNLSRVRELAVQSSSGTTQNAERSFINTESSSLINEITRLANVTAFNGQPLLNGATTTATGSITLDVQIGIFNTTNDRININFSASSARALGINMVDLTTSANSQSAITSIDSAISLVANIRAMLGASQNRLSTAISSLSSYTENLSAAKSQILDVDFASETAEMSRYQVLQQAGVSILSQANTSGQAAISLLQK